MIGRRIYDFFSFVWHKIFRMPVRMAVAKDNHTKNPRLTVVMLHGIAATSNTWRKFYKDVSRDPELSDVRLIALDLLGFGKSPKADWLDYDYDDYVRALDETFKRLKIKTPIILMGHSMGSLIIAKYITEEHLGVEVQSVILVSPPLLMASEMARLPDKVYMNTYGSLQQLAKDVPAVDVIAKIVERFSNFEKHYLKTRAFENSMENIILNHNNYQTFRKIKIPTLILHGHFDPLVMGANLRKAAKTNKNLTYQSVIADHDITATKRVRIIRQIKKVLKNEQDEII